MRVEDALHATRAAVEEGIVAGSGAFGFNAATEQFEDLIASG